MSIRSLVLCEICSVESFGGGTVDMATVATSATLSHIDASRDDGRALLRALYDSASEGGLR